MANDANILDDCIRMMRDCAKQCEEMKGRAQGPAAKAILTCCASCCDAMARSCEEVRGTL